MNCKPGQMAEIIYTQDGKDLGAIVEVQYGVGIDEDGDFAWACKPAWPITMYCDGGIEERKISAEVVEIPDAWLRPIRPPETPVTQDVPEELTA